MWKIVTERKKSSETVSHQNWQFSGFNNGRIFDARGLSMIYTPRVRRRHSCERNAQLYCKNCSRSLKLPANCWFLIDGGKMLYTIVKHLNGTFPSLTRVARRNSRSCILIQWGEKGVAKHLERFKLSNFDLGSSNELGKMKICHRKINYLLAFYNTRAPLH